VTDWRKKADKTEIWRKRYEKCSWRLFCKSSVY